MIVLAIREYGAYVWILLFAAHIFVTLCHIWMQVNLEELKWQDFSLLFLNVLMHVYSPINMMTKSTFFRYMIGYLIEFAENIACIAFWCSAVKFDFPYKVVVAIVVFLLNIIGLVLLIVRLRYFSSNEDEEDRRGSSSVPLTTFLKSPALND
uniref:XK-related protein n=1 Tax=Acrobeloides nanus TaxID=290746 RepID=A0A914CC43_9BILA